MHTFFFLLVNVKQIFSELELEFKLKLLHRSRYDICHNSALAKTKASVASMFTSVRQRAACDDQLRTVTSARWYWPHLKHNATAKEKHWI